MRFLHLAVLALATLSASIGAAQDGRPSLDELVDTERHSDDPIGIDDESDLSSVPGPPGPAPPETPDEIARRGPRPPTVRAADGQVVTAISAVRETHHAVDVTLEDGLAVVTVELTFSSRARHPAEVRYRLATPEGAALSSLRVCVSDRCRDGLSLGDAGRVAYDAAVRARGEDDAAPVAAAEHVRDERGEALSILAAPVPPRGTLIVEVRYVAPAPVVGGVARLTLPGRGQDPRAAPTSVSASATSMIGVVVDELPFEAPIVRDTWYPIAVAARLPTSAPAIARVTRFPCGEERCARVTATAGPRGGIAEDLVLALDASPSTEGPARSRIAPTVAAILSAAPRDARVWALAFGAEARTLVESPRAPDDVPLVPLARSVNRELGSATRIEEALNRARALVGVAESRGRRPIHLVIIGDGGLTRGPSARQAFAEARAAGVKISVVDVADRATWAALDRGARSTGGAVIEAGAEADLAVGGRSSSELEERISRLFAPDVRSNVAVVVGRRRIALGNLLAGEQLVWQGVVPGGRVSLRGAGRTQPARVDEARARALAGIVTGQRTALFAVARADAASDAATGDARCIDERGPARRAGGVSSDAAPVALALPRSCDPRGPPAAPATTSSESTGRGVPAETVLRMLRQRVMPVARRCFRRDRAGRLDYSVRATFVIRLEDRELTEAQVDGRITDGLRACLMSAAHQLDVPRFRGAVVVRYPLYTEAVRRPPVIELIPEVAEGVDAVVPPEGRASDQ
jgi:hypothetical protein